MGKGFIPYRKSKKQFTILKKLGSGVFSEVYLAMDKKSGWVVCMKIINKSSVKNTPGEAK